MLKDVRVSDRLRFYGIGENHRGYPLNKDIRVFGADTETVKGLLHTFQIASQGEEIFKYTDPQSGFKQLCDWIDARAIDKGVNLVFFHNLKFDLSVLLYDNHQAIYDQYNEISLERDGYSISMFYGRVNFVTVRRELGIFDCPGCGELPKLAVRQICKTFYCTNPIHGEPTKVKKRRGAVVKWIDSSAFCPPGQKSLAAALKIYGVPYKKMAAPEGLGDVAFRHPAFEKYAMNDARAEEALGLAILGVHKKYDITPSVSLPQLSGRILRHHFFKRGERFHFPPEECRLAAELSYHAGKNGFYVKPGVYDDLYEYDINSAFPRAMKEMPQIVKGKYCHVKKYKAGVMGIYRISGRVSASCRFPVVFDAGFKPVHGPYKNQWITGYEYEILARARGNAFKVLEGWIWRHDKTYDHSPLGEFVDQFWTLKSKAPKGPERDTFKNILNSLYGKFAACVEKRVAVDTALGPRLTSDHEGKYYTSGALYHPFIATQITGYVRARLWELETAGKALHAATDSIKSRLNLPCSDGLGGIKKETFGRCYLFRNKLYLHFAKDTSLCGHDVKRGWLSIYKEELDRLPAVGDALLTGRTYDAADDRWWGKLFEPDGQHLCKVGLHGFKGSPFELYRNRDRLLKTGHLDYHYNHMTQLREGFKRGETVCTMTRRAERLSLKVLAPA